MSETFDREKARALLDAIGDLHDSPRVVNPILDALAECVVPATPQTIDRDAVLNSIRSVAPAGMELRYDGTEDPVASAYVAGVQAAHAAAAEVLALVRPVEGIVLSPEETAIAVGALRTVRAEHFLLTHRYREQMRALTERLEAHGG